MPTYRLEITQTCLTGDLKELEEAGIIARKKQVSLWRQPWGFSTTFNGPWPWLKATVEQGASDVGRRAIINVITRGIRTEVPKEPRLSLTKGIARDYHI